MNDWRGYDKLKGKVVLACFVDKARETIRLNCSEPTPVGGRLCVIDLVTEGDCCSQTWIEHVSGFGEFGWDSIVNKKVTAVEEVDLGDVGHKLVPTKQDYDQLYCLTIKFIDCDPTGMDLPGEKLAQIEFRNSSNGYYGGDLQVHEIEGMLPKPVYDGFDEIKEDF